MGKGKDTSLPELTAPVAIQLAKMRERGYRGIAVVVDPVGELIIAEALAGGWRLLGRGRIPPNVTAPWMIHRMPDLRLEPGLTPAQIAEAVAGRLHLDLLNETGARRH